MLLEGQLLNNRYRILSVIGSGGMSTVYLASDTADRNGNVAVKVLDSSRTSRRIEDIIRFRTEALAAAGIDHPGIVKIFDVGVVESGYHSPIHYLVMEYLEGPSLQKKLEEEGDIPVPEALSIIEQAADALAEIHSRGIIHRDIKPGNIIPVGSRTVLIDFGLAQVKEYDRDENIFAAGSFHYIAPEQIRVTRGTADERSDLYSLGVLFYRLIAGALPFEGGDINSIIHRHIAMKPLPPSALRPETPPVINSVIMKLLEKEPENRYLSARGLASDIRKIRSGAREFIPGLDDRSIRLSYKTRIIGRRDELILLKNRYKLARPGKGGFCFITGNAGYGKTRLIDEFRRHVYSEKGLFISGKCFHGDGKTPYGVISEVLTDYLRYYRSFPSVKREKISIGIRKSIGELGEIVRRINPAMEEILGPCPPLVELKSNRESARFQMVASRFLASLAAESGGIVMVLDDIQWIDNGSVDLLNELVNYIGKSPLLVIAAFRSGEENDNPPARDFLEKLRGDDSITEMIELKPLDRDEMSEFISGILMTTSEISPEITDFIFKRSAGNPLHAIQVLKELITSHALKYDDVWRFDPSILEELSFPSDIIDSILKKTSELSDEELNILSLAAVIGRRFDMSLLFSLAGTGSGTPPGDSETVAIVDRAIELQILERNSGDPRKIQFVHDRILEAFYKRIHPRERKILHENIGKALEKFSPEENEGLPYDLAHHFINSGNREKILLYAMPAALGAKDNYANDVAVRYLYIIKHLLEEDPALKNRDDLQELWAIAVETLGEVYHTIGEYDKAITLFNSVLSNKKTAVDKANLYKQISRAYFKKGDWSNCEAFGKKSLDILGERLPVSKPAVLLSIAVETLKQPAYPLFRFMAPLLRRKKERYEHIAWLYLDLGWSYILSDIHKFLRTALRTINVAKYRVGLSKILGMAYAIFGSLWMSIGVFNRAERCYERSLSIRETLGDIWGRGQTLQWLGFSFEWKGDYNASLKCFSESYDIFRKIGDIREMGMSLAGKIHNHTYLGDYSRAAEALDEYLDISLRTGDDYGISESWTYRTQYHIETGDLEKAGECGKKAFDYSREKNILFTHCRASIELGYRHLEAGDFDEAIRVLEYAREIYESGNYLKHFTVHLYAHLCEAYLGKTLSGKNPEPGAESRLLKAAGRFRDRALKEGNKWKSHKTAALRAAAKCAILRGKPARVRKLFNAAIEHADKTGRKFEAMKTRYELARFLMRGDNPSSAMELLETAYAECLRIGAGLYKNRISELLGMGAEDSTSLGRLIGREKLDSIIRLSNSLSEISDMDTLLEKVVSRSMEVTGAQRAFFFLTNPASGDLELKASRSITEEAGTEYSRSIVDETMATGKERIIADASHEGEDADNRSVILRNLKSVLCVPVKMEDRTIGAFYLDNPLAGGVFSKEETRLIDILLSQTAMALHNIYLRSRKSSTSGKPVPIQVSSEKLGAVAEFIGKNYLSDITRESIAEEFNMNPDYLGKAFKVHRGIKIGDYINELRIEDAAKKLAETDSHIIDIAYSTGFESLRTFNRVFWKIKRSTPTEYREKFGKENTPGNR